MGAFPEKLMQGLRKGLYAFAIRLQERVKRKLSDEVLHVRTGTLRRSINQQVTETSSSLLATVGTNIDYAAVHEYGFNGTVTVAGHIRKLREGRKMRLVGAKKHNGIGEWQSQRGSLTGGVAYVNSYTRKVNLPERSFLRSALKELEQDAIITVEQAVAGALKP